jgi:hypothetical protein
MPLSGRENPKPIGLLKEDGLLELFSLASISDAGVQNVQSALVERFKGSYALPAEISQ